MLSPPWTFALWLMRRAGFGLIYLSNWNSSRPTLGPRRHSRSGRSAQKSAPQVLGPFTCFLPFPRRLQMVPPLAKAKIIKKRTKKFVRFQSDRRQGSIGVSAVGASLAPLAAHLLRARSIVCFIFFQEGGFFSPLTLRFAVLLAVFSSMGCARVRGMAASTGCASCQDILLHTQLTYHWAGG